MIHKVALDLENVTIYLTLDDKIAPKTILAFLDCLPLSVKINMWGEELYTDKTPINVSSENSKPIVDLMDVAYWPPGRAICLFFGPTPIGTKGEIIPYSPVNVIGKITGTDKNFLKEFKDGIKGTFQLVR
jgi:uncharacterized protein